MPDAPPLPAPAQLLQLLTSMATTQMLAVAARLRLPDHLQAGPRPASEVAEAAGSHPGATYRLMRGLAVLGVLEEGEGRRFSLTPVGACLCSDHPASLADFARYVGSGWHWAIWSELLHSVETGRSAFSRKHGRPFFEWLPEHPAALKAFGDGMTSLGRLALPALVAGYDFSSARRIADIGGGHGSLLALILERHPEASGVLFERPEVAARARQLFAEGSLAGRFEALEGDFFRAVPGACDTYLLQHILHDWDDELAVAILSNIARAMLPSARLLVIEHVVAPPGVPQLTKIIDVEMLVLMEGGRERTLDEFTQLFRAAGLELTGVRPTASPLSIVEARAARAGVQRSS